MSLNLGLTMNADVWACLIHWECVDVCTERLCMCVDVDVSVQKRARVCVCALFVSLSQFVLCAGFQ